MSYDVNHDSNWKYVIAVVVMAVIGVLGVLVITIIRPKEDNTILITMVLGFLAPTTLSLLSLMKSQETHLSVNSRLDDFMTTAREASRAEGIIEGQSMRLVGKKGPQGDKGDKGDSGDS